MSACVLIGCHRSHDQNKQANSRIGQVFLHSKGNKRSTLYKESKISKSTWPFPCLEITATCLGPRPEREIVRIQRYANPPVLLLHGDTKICVFGKQLQDARKPWVFEGNHQHQGSKLLAYSFLMDDSNFPRIHIPDSIIRKQHEEMARNMQEMML